MSNQLTIYILLRLCMILLSFKSVYRSQYTIPSRAYSVTTADLNSDDYQDIIIGHMTAWQYTNPTISILLNDNGFFEVTDTSQVFCGYQENIMCINLNQDIFPDIVAFYSDFTSGNAERYIRVFMNDEGEINEFTDFSLYSSSTFHYINYGDINNDSFYDIVLISNNDQFWGVMYNDGQGNFSEPDYTYVSSYYPTDISCGDLNNDNRDDIVICGQDTEVYFSYEEGFEVLVLATDDMVDQILINDFDLDNDNDILCLRGFAGSTFLQCYENLGNNQFDTLDQIVFQPMSYKMFLADINNDSYADAIFQLTDLSGYLIYYNLGNFQLGDAFFVEVPGPDPPDNYRSFCCEDMDGNGYNDLVIARAVGTGGEDGLIILFNDGHNNFQEDPITEIPNSNISNSNAVVTAFPNPFYDQCIFEFDVTPEKSAELEIYTMQGRLVRSLSLEGRGRIIWDGKNQSGKTCEAGQYIAKLWQDQKVETIKLIKN